MSYFVGPGTIPGLGANGGPSFSTGTISAVAGAVTVSAVATFVSAADAATVTENATVTIIQNASGIVDSIVNLVRSIGDDTQRIFAFIGVYHILKSELAPIFSNFAHLLQQIYNRVFN